MRGKKFSWEAVVLGSIAMFAAVFVPTVRTAHADGAETDGKIVEIAPASDNDLPTVDGGLVVEEEKVIEEQRVTPFWIGVRGRNVDDPVLRTQFQLAGDMGVVVEDVVKESPASEAGLRQHDIVLRANGEPLQSMDQLRELVRSGNGKPIELLLLRLAKQEKLVIAPQKMPADMIEGREGRGFQPGNIDLFQDLLQGEGNIIRMLPNGGFGLNAQLQMNNALPNGYSVSITRQNNQPPQITVKKGDQTWTVVSDDDEALQELPEEIRGSVKRMMQGNIINFGDIEDWGRGMRARLPDRFMNPQPHFPGPEFGDEHRDRVLQRMEEMEQRLQQLQEQIDEEMNP